VRVPLTPYGRREILAVTALWTLCLALGCWLVWPLALAASAVWIAVLAFFRDPDRPVRPPPHGLLSPADGRVTDVDHTDSPCEFLPGPAVRVSVFMSLLDVHVNRAPGSGVVRWRTCLPGAHRDARDPRAASENECCMLGIQSADGRRVVVKQIAGLLARRVVCAADVGRRLSPGERFGMVKLGSRVEVFVPCGDGFTTTVRPGDRVRAGVDVIGVYEE
jgi:phosphatidylserine decarboxylase